MFRRVTVILALAIVAVIPFAAFSAQADTRCIKRDPTTYKCILQVTTPEVAPDPGSQHEQGSGDEAAPAADKPRDTGPGSPCTMQDVLNPEGAEPWVVPCSSGDGAWSNELQCYVSRANPQPPPSDPVWEGRGAGSGAIYRCSNLAQDFESFVWLAAPPDVAAQGPTPGEVAQEAVEQMDLRAIDIGIAPRPDGVGLVGVPVWLWVDNPSPSTFGPVTESASAGGITVTATARVHRLTWDMGDGTTIECASAGTPYRESFGFKPSPDCGHIYTSESHGRPSGKYTVTATSDWVVEWEGAGQEGTITLDGLVAQVELTVGEAQVLVS
jgi:hypothetical protein